MNSVPARVVTKGLLASIVVVLLAQGVERLINRVFRPDAAEWTWIDAVVVAAAFFVAMMLWFRLRETRQALSLLERERVVLDTQLSIAANLQRALLPATPPPSDGLEWSAETVPAGKVGGDYFDFIPLPDGRMWVVVADVSGKGVPAAIFLSNVRAVLRTLVRDTSEPRELARRLSEEVAEDARGGMYVSAILLLVDPAGRLLTYTNAGHPAGLMLRSNQREMMLTAGGPPAGLVPGAPYEQETLACGPGDLVVLVTDGVTESLDASGDSIPTAIMAALAGLRELSPASACRRLLEAAARGTGPGVHDWSDDRTVVAFGGRVLMGSKG